MKSPGFAFDDTNLNTGENEGQAGIIHAINSAAPVTKDRPHQVELAENAALSGVPYLNVTKRMTKFINDIAAHFNVSPKRLFGLNHIGKMLGERILKMGNLHGIRWQRSRQRPIRAFLADWRSATISLHEFGKRHAQQSLLGPYNRVYLSSPLAVYEGAQFRRHFVGHGMHVGTVVGVADLDAESKWLDVKALQSNRGLEAPETGFFFIGPSCVSH